MRLFRLSRMFKAIFSDWCVWFTIVRGMHCMHSCAMGVVLILCSPEASSCHECCIRRRSMFVQSSHTHTPLCFVRFACLAARVKSYYCCVPCLMIYSRFLVSNCLFLASWTWHICAFRNMLFCTKLKWCLHCHFCLHRRWGYGVRLCSSFASYRRSICGSSRRARVGRRGCRRVLPCMRSCSFVLETSQPLNLSTVLDFLPSLDSGCIILCIKLLF